MKKKSVAIASFIAFGSYSIAAMAQSSISIYGNLDQTLVQQSQAGKSATTSGSNNNSTSYWGITGTEDIGSGIKTSFDLRSEITLLTGQAAQTSTSATNAGQTSTAAVTQNTVTNAGDKPSFFNRGAYVKIEKSDLGVFTIGRQGDLWFNSWGEVNTATGASGSFATLVAMQLNSTNFSNLVSGIPNTTAISNFAGSASSAGININPTYIGTSNGFMGGMTFETPTISGMSAAYQMGIPKISYNDPGSANNGAAYVLRYDQNGLRIRVSESYKNDYAGSKAWVEDLVGMTYSFGAWKVALSNNKMKFQASAIGNGTTATAAGLFYNVSSALTLNVSYGQLKDDVTSSNTFKTTSLNAQYKLSPRSTIYAGIFNGVNAGQMKQTPIYGGSATDTLNATVNAYSLGIKHMF